MGAALGLLLAVAVSAVPLGLLGKERAGSRQFCEEVLEGYCETAQDRFCGDGRDGICAANCPAGLGILTWDTSDKNFKHYASCLHPAKCCTGIFLQGGCGATACVIPFHPASEALVKILLFRARADIESTIIGYKTVDGNGVVTGDDDDQKKADQRFVQFEWQKRSTSVTAVVKTSAEATHPAWNDGGQEFKWAPTDQPAGIKAYIGQNEDELKNVFGPSAVLLCEAAVDEVESVWSLANFQGQNLVSRLIIFIVQRGQALKREEALEFYSWLKEGQDCEKYNVNTAGNGWGELAEHAGGVGDHVWNQANAGLFHQLFKWKDFSPDSQARFKAIQNTQDKLSAKPTTAMNPATGLCNYYEWNKHMWGKMSVIAYLGTAEGYVKAKTWTKEQAGRFNKVVLLTLFLYDLDVQAAIRVANGVKKLSPPGATLNRAALLAYFDTWAVAALDAAKELTASLPD